MQNSSVYRVLDNELGIVLAIVFSKDDAMMFLNALPNPQEKMDDGETFRYAFEKVDNHEQFNKMILRIYSEFGYMVPAYCYRD